MWMSNVVWCLAFYVERAMALMGGWGGGVEAQMKSILAWLVIRLSSCVVTSHFNSFSSFPPTLPPSFASFSLSLPKKFDAPPCE